MELSLNTLLYTITLQMYVLAELASNITAIQQKLPVDKLFIYETLSILD